MEMCRVCLSTQADIVPFDENFISNFKLLTNLEITLNDEMPQFVCLTCMETISLFINFREKAISSEIALKELISEKIKVENKNEAEPDGMITHDGTMIKLELKQEYYDDEDLFEFGYDTFNEFIHTDNKADQAKRKVASRKTIKFQKQISDDDKELFCGLCPDTFEDIDALKRHVDSHEKDRQCSTCLEIFPKRHQILAHRLIHLPKKQRRCHKCNKHYLSTISLEYHYMKIHFGETPKLTCTICLKIYDTPRKLNSHIWSLHTNQYYCDMCSKSFRNKSHLKNHILSHSDKRNYVCDLCAFSCKYLSGLKDHHARRHTSDKVTCKKCSRLFENQVKYDRHKCGVASCICPVCGKDIRNKKSLNRHLKSHSDTLNYGCPRCPAKFKTRGGLKTHLDRHDGNKTYQCEFCQRKFYTCSVLTKHRRIHTGEKPYVCKVCNKGFTGNNNLKLHMRVHGEYLIVKKDRLLESEKSLDVIHKGL